MAGPADAAPSPPPLCCCGLPYDGVLSFVTRALRMFNYGAIAPVFFLYLLELGYSEVSIGALLSAILVGDLVITLYLSTRADAFGRKRTLIIASALKVLAGAAFASTSSFPALAAAGVVGVISTSGGEIGPFMAVEQAALTDSVLAAREAAGAGAPGGSTGAGDVAVLYGWYNTVGYLAQAAGAVTSGVVVHYLQSAAGWSALASYRVVFVAYGAVGAAMALLYATLTPAAEARKRPPPPPADAPAGCCPPALAPYAPAVSVGLRRPESRHIVARLAVMFAMDAFAGAFVMQTWIAFWFNQRWGFSSDLVGYLLMGANVVAGLSGVAAAYFVKAYGAMLTMIASHLPSNVLLLAVPFMPTGPAAAAMLVARFSISQMDVPARQAYVVMVVASDERSAAGGITNIVRSLGMSAAPSVLGYLSAAPRGSFLFASPWVIAGVIKIVYDLVLYGLYLSDTTMNTGEAKAGERDAAEAAAAARHAADGARAAAAGGGRGELAAPLLASAEEGAEEGDEEGAEEGAGAGAAKATASVNA